MKEFYNENKLLLWLTFAICVLLAILSNASAYSTYSPSTQNIDYNSFVNTYGPVTNDNLGSLYYLENLFNFIAPYYASFTNAFTFDNSDHIMGYYWYRPSQNEMTGQICYSISPVSNLTNGVPIVTAESVCISFNNYAQTFRYYIYYGFNSGEYYRLGNLNSLSVPQGGTTYGYLSNNNNYGYVGLGSIWDMTYLDIFAYTNTVYNPDLLDNDPRFKKICVNNQRSLFSVIPDNIDLSVDGSYSDYMLVPSFVRGIQYGDLYYNFSSGNSNLLYMSPDNGDLNTFLQQYDFVSSDYMAFIKNTPEMAAFRQKYGDLYNQLYGWAVFPLKYMLYHSSLDPTVREWSTFVYFLDSAYTEGVECDTVIVGGSTYCEESNSGGGGREPGVVPILEDTCFYIPVDYTYKLWTVNDYGDITDTITIDNSNFNINSDYFEDEYNDFQTDNSYSGYLGYFKYLLSKCATPIGFINAKLTLFFNKLPELIRYLVISLIVIGLLIGIIKFLTGGK